MKTKSFLLASVLCSMTFVACETKTMCDCSDEIKLSQKKFYFNSTGDSCVVSAKGKWGGMNCVYLDTSLINVYASATDNCNVTYIDANIEIISKDCNRLFVKMNANNTNSDRVLNIGVSAGDYYDGIKIVQAKK